MTDTKDKNILVESERLLLRRLDDTDLPTLQRIFGDAEMMRYLGSAWDEDKTAQVLREWREDWGVEHRWTGILIRKDSQAAIGTAGITENTLTNELGFELSWFVLPEHQKQGFAAEITKELARFTFDVLGAVRMVAETHPENPASNRVLEKLGFNCLGERHNTFDDLPGFDTQVLWELVRK